MLFLEIAEKYSNINFEKIRPMGAGLLHANGNTGRYKKHSGRLWQFHAFY